MVGAEGGLGDCERFRGGLLEQPANALTSLAFIALAAVLLWRAARVRPGRGRGDLIAFAVVALALGLGSLAYHGPQTAGSRWLHDFAIAWWFVLVLVRDAGQLRGREPPTSVPTLLGMTAAVAVLLALVPDANRPVFAAVGVGAAATEIALVRRGQRPRPGDGASWVAWLVAGAVACVGIAAYFLGATGRPLCSPGSWLQGHALWHLCQAVAAGAYVRAVAWGGRAVDRSDRDADDGRVGPRWGRPWSRRAST